MKAGLVCSPSTRPGGDPYSAYSRRARDGTQPASVPVEGLQMSQDFTHHPVLVGEVVELLSAVPAGVVVDATVGGGGHAAALLSAAPHLRVLGIDRDEVALDAARHALADFGGRVTLRHARFDELERLVAELGRPAVTGALFDLGVSSPQFDQPDRGFSYRSEAPLDMRMDRSGGITAADIVNGYDERRLARLFADSGEGRFARRIARFVVAARPLLTTTQLAEVVRSALPAATRRTGGHPAKRVFQALRIEVNGELEVLGPALDAALGLLAPGGRCVVLSYHSGEDRLVKQHFVEAATGGCTCPPGLPCACGAEPTVRLITRGSRPPSAEEVASNPRAASARLRAVERLPRAGSSMSTEAGRA